MLLNIAELYDICCKQKADMELFQFSPAKKRIQNAESVFELCIIKATKAQLFVRIHRKLSTLLRAQWQNAKSFHYEKPISVEFLKNKHHYWVSYCESSASLTKRVNEINKSK